MLQMKKKFQSQRCDAVELNSEEAVAFEVVVFSEAADGQFEAGPRRRNAPQLRFFLATHTQV